MAKYNTEVYKREIFLTKRLPYKGYCLIQGRKVDAHIAKDDTFEVTVGIGGSFICPDCSGSSGHSVIVDETGCARCMCGSAFVRIRE